MIALGLGFGRHNAKYMNFSEDTKVGLTIAAVLIGLIILAWFVWFWLK